MIVYNHPIIINKRVDWSKREVSQLVKAIQFGAKLVVSSIHGSAVANQINIEAVTTQAPSTLSDISKNNTS